jgi:Na+/H+ antiporter NhaD/arsenite permease-like protein
MRARIPAWVRGFLTGVICLPISTAAQAAPALDGAGMSWPWAIPFAGVLLSIATGPLLFPRLWHHHYGKIVAVWAALALAPIAVRFGPTEAVGAFVHAMLVEYLSFIVVLFALYTVAGGILITGRLRGTPIVNVVTLALGTITASFAGTTGASMIFIRPLLRANAGRRYQTHVVIFFILLVGNVGGALSPLGDPPLFIGFLRGVEFFWPLRNLWVETLFVAVVLLMMFAILDTVLGWRDQRSKRDASAEIGPLRVRGLINVLLLGLIIAVMLFSALWRPGMGFTVLGTRLEAQNLARDGALILIALASLWLTPNEHRQSNGFTWEPIREVGLLFAGIFTAILPVLAMLHAGRSGPFAAVLDLVTNPDGSPNHFAYFWLTGLLSAFLDNAPTYLVFFELAGGDAQHLMGPLSGTLAAISLGAVFMGALTYVGNAPNLMVYAIASERGVEMPSFFTYLAIASGILLPIFLVVNTVPFLKP